MKNTEYYHNAVHEFIRTFNQRTYPSTSKTPYKVLTFRGDLIDEEHEEYQKGIKDNDPEAQLDGLCDLMYVVVGTLITVGLSTGPFIATSKGSSQHLKLLVDDLVDECYQPRPCCVRMSGKANAVIHETEKCAYGKFKFFDAFVTVHKNNMDKLWPAPLPAMGLSYRFFEKGNKFLVKNPEGKVLKPPGHTKPNLKPYIL